MAIRSGSRIEHRWTIMRRHTTCSNNLCWIPFRPHNIIIAPPISPSKFPSLVTNIELVQHLHLVFAQTESRIPDILHQIIHLSVTILRNGHPLDFGSRSRPRHANISLLQRPPHQKLRLRHSPRLGEIRHPGPPLLRSIRTAQLGPRRASHGDSIRIAIPHHVRVCIKRTQFQLIHRWQVPVILLPHRLGDFPQRSDAVIAHSHRPHESLIAQFDQSSVRCQSPFAIGCRGVNRREVEVSHARFGDGGLDASFHGDDVGGLFVVREFVRYE
mmetsp:Transcript_30545/g.66017  ORF Transcript_30545/g.66017 Transcript_30545/m.66017 type:complete len:271 (-) Transcript_30545:1231-2043(-)